MAGARTVAVEEQGRDHGLVRGIGIFGMAAAITNEVIGSGVYRLPASMAAAAGAAAPLAYVACLIAMGAIVLCFAEAGSRVPTSGGPYGYVEAAFGPLAGFVAGVLVWLSALLACGGVAAAVADILGAAVPALSDALPRGLFIVALLGGMAWVNIRGADTAARFIGVTTLIKLVPLGLFLIVGGIALASGHGATTAVTAPPVTTIDRAALLAFFALSGMETPLSASGEVRDPARNVPRALLLAMGGIGLLYIGVQIVADGLLGAGLAASKTPLADAMGTIGAGWRVPLLAGAFLSMLFWIGSDLLGAPRVLFALSRDRLLPAAFGRLHPRWHTPHVAILFHAGLAILLALSGTYEALAILSTLTIAPLYFGACASAWVLRRRDVAVMGEALRLPALPVVALVGMASTIALVAFGRLAEVAALAGVLAGSALIYAIMRRR
ncbi:APC family permease [Sphingomonas nostoxanthinifaciens]|uniref:APC family permease n=1 Tax=Sphingomonas nostoxanthinifaciens TaxID=2872652 RepID=UPI001CC1CCC2|nr:APC family permease [Sphingomonas nostoxanthinifaciens]UAK26239.1 APC family permease [Sphingomonas nostoxanthinifaciens]